MKNPTTRPTSGNPPARSRPQQGASIARRQAAATTRRTVPATPRPQAQVEERTLATGLPLSAHRILAVLALLLLLILSLVGPRSNTASSTAALITPNISGGNSLPGGVAANDVEDSLFRYRTVIERTQGNAPLVPDNVADVLHYAPDTVRVRKLLAGQMYASTSGNIDTLLVDTGFFANVTSQLLGDIEATYREFLSDEKRAPRGINGLGVMSLIRSLDATGDERVYFEQTGLAGLQQAINLEPGTWEFTYNWSLANMMLGNYSAAYDGMRGIVAQAETENNIRPRFWMALAALRMGEPGIAKQAFQSVIDKQITGGNSAFQQSLETIRDLAREGYADAQWANREPAAAYSTYFNSLANTNTDDLGLYTKWLRLGIQQRAYDKLAGDMAALETSGSGLSKSPRLHHDRARLLTFLGRGPEAENEYKQALSLGENDPSLLVSYGQYLESAGQHNDALSQADQAIRGLGKDPAGADLTDVSHSVAVSTTSYTDLYNGQQLLDANLLRARVWGATNQTSSLDGLISNISAGAANAPAAEAGLLDYYAGAVAEAGGAYDKAVSNYSAAWDKLKNSAPGTTGRAATLAGLARATEKTKDAAAGAQVLTSNGYDPANPKQEWTSDADAPELLYQGSLLLEDAGNAAESANAMRVAGILRNSQDARLLNGIGRPLWDANGTIVPANAMLASADQVRTTQGSDPNLAAYRYKQVYSLDPSMAAAWNNLGVIYARSGNNTLGNFYLDAAGKVSPNYALGQHNQAVLAYKQGFGNFFNAEAAQAGAIKSAGASALNWGYDLQADDTGPFPQPRAVQSDLLSRLPAIIILLLLLVHTAVGNDRLTNRMGLLPAKGALGMLAGYVDGFAKRTFPRLVTPGSGTNALLVSIVIPSVIGMLGLAIGAARWSLGVAVLFLPVALLASLLAFGSNELAQQWTAKRHRADTAHHPWPLGVALGILSIPLGFVYGWQVITRVRPVGAAESAADAVARRARTEEEQDLAYEAQVEALAEMSPEEARSRAGAPMAAAAPATGLFNLSPASRIMFAGLLANLALVVIFGAAYWLLAWPSLRIGMYASALVLAFTAVSEPPADGWTLYRRNAPLWLALFAFAATVVTLLAAGLM